MQYEAIKTIDLPRQDIFIESGTVFDENELAADVLAELLASGRVAPVEDAAPPKKAAKAKASDADATEAEDE